MAIVRKIYQQGNSVVVSIPTYMLDNLKLKIGDTVSLEATPRPSIELRPLIRSGRPVDLAPLRVDVEFIPKDRPAE